MRVGAQGQAHTASRRARHVGKALTCPECCEPFNGVIRAAATPQGFLCDALAAFRGVDSDVTNVEAGPSAAASGSWVAAAYSR